MPKARKKKTAPEVAQLRIVNEEQPEYTVQDAVRMVRISLPDVMA
jgi:hypothetical protein